MDLALRNLPAIKTRYADHFSRAQRLDHRPGD
jgi:hypothetical protein